MGWLLLVHLYFFQQAALSWTPGPPAPGIPGNVVAFNVYRAERFCRTTPENNLGDQYVECFDSRVMKIATVNAPYYNDVKILSGHTYVWTINAVYENGTEGNSSVSVVAKVW